MRESLRRKRVEGFLITNLVNIRYLSGFRGTSACILLTKKRAFFITDFRYKEEAERQFRIWSEGEFFPPSEWELIIEKGGRPKTVRKLIEDIGLNTLGFESSVSYEFFEDLSRWSGRLLPIRGVVERLRAVKDEEEIAHIREAVRRAEAAFLDVKPFIRKGRRERELSGMLDERLRKRGCNHIPFDIIVASGSNSAMPHAKTTERKLAPGDLVVIDWGGEADGYFSDMTRTFLLPGGEEASGKKEIYQTVLRANRSAIASVRPGREGRIVDGAARNSIKRAGYGEYFGHGTGHGVGLEVHELPRITWTKRDSIEENMVFTIEPGLYIPGLGGVRIEDMVLVRSGTAEILTTLPVGLEMIG